MSLGVMGEYLGRMFDETKRRPLYLIATYEPAHETTNASSEVSVLPFDAVSKLTGTQKS